MVKQAQRRPVIFDWRAWQSGKERLRREHRRDQALQVVVLGSGCSDMPAVASTTPEVSGGGAAPRTRRVGLFRHLGSFHADHRP